MTPTATSYAAADRLIAEVTLCVDADEVLGPEVGARYRAFYAAETAHIARLERRRRAVDMLLRTLTLWSIGLLAVYGAWTIVRPHLPEGW